MAKVKITGHASGTGILTVTAPNTSTDRTITLPDATGTLLNSDGSGANLTNLPADSTKLPLAGGTMTGDLILGDNVKLEVGSASGGDLQIYHNASNSYVSDQGTGHLKILGTHIVMMNAAETKNYLYATDGDSVALYHNNNSKLATSATGITVTGAIAGATNLGKVLQISQGLLGSTTTTTSSSYVATSLYLSITPSATSSKVLVMMSGGMNGFAGGSGGEGNFTLYKDVGGGGYSQIDATTRGLGTLRWSSGDNYAPLSINYLDSPNTTSAVTYKLYMKLNSGNGTLSLNRDSNGITQIQLIEIGA